MLTRSEFLATYREELLNLFPWAQDAEKLGRFMASCEATIAGTATSWVHDGDAVKIAWNRLGGKGRPTLKALRALAD